MRCTSVLCWHCSSFVMFVFGVSLCCPILVSFMKRASLSQQAQVGTTTKPEDVQTLITRAVSEVVLGKRPLPGAAASGEID